MKYNVRVELPDEQKQNNGFIIEVNRVGELHYHIGFEEELDNDNEEPLPVHTKLIIERVE